MRFRAVLPYAVLVLAALLALRLTGHPLPRLSTLRATPAVALLVLGTVANVLLCGWRWSALSGLRPLACVRWYGESVFLSLTVPGGVGGATYRIGRASGPAGRISAVASVTLDRVISRVVTLVLAVPCGVVVLGARSTLLLAAVAAAALLPLAVVRRGRPGRPPGVAAAVQAVAQPRRVLVAALLTVVYLALFAGCLLLVAAAVGVPLSVAHALLNAPLVALAGMLPSVHGAGPAQAATGFTLTTAGGSPTAAVAAAGLLLVVGLGAAAVGGVSLLVNGRRPWKTMPA